jgi:RND superfamily putative drug exporter
MPLKAIFLNIMSIGASFGALVFIFQQGHFQNILDFTPVGYLDILLPIVLFCVLFGLSMDYEVFLLTRIKEAYDRTGNNTDAIVEGLERTGRIITSSALLTIIVTASFAFTSIIFVKALGLGIAISVLIDSTLIRAVLVPASMRLMGDWNWWSPAWGKRSLSS